jgi:hypothetical protein
MRSPTANVHDEEETKKRRWLPACALFDRDRDRDIGRPL